MKWIPFVIYGLVVAGCASGAPLQTSSPEGAGTARVTVTRIEAVEQPTFYEAVGAVRARYNATLSSKVMARVSGVFAREGDSVSRGQSLVDLDARELSAAVRVAKANLSASTVGVDNARTAREMEAKTSAARISQAEAALQQSRAALGAAQSKFDLSLAGPRAQERTQAHLAVVQAESNLRLAKIQLDRVSGLVGQGAMPKRSLDEAQNGYDLALAQRDTAIQAEKIAQEGSRAEDIRTAREGVAQAQAAVRQAEANLAQAHASSLQTKVRADEVRSAQAQVSQSSAALQSAEVSLGYAKITAPFDGKIVRRSVDPGSMATPGAPLVAMEGGDLRLEAIVPESVLNLVRQGARIAVTVDALHRDVTGMVDEILPQGDPTSHTFIVKLVLLGDGGVRSGMFGRALIPTGSALSIEVPNSAVWEREGLHYLYVLNPEGIARLRIVTTGVTRGNRVVVLSGLAPGERIVSEGHERVSDGMKVSGR